MTKKAPGMFAVVFSRAAHALGSPRPWKPLYRLAKHWAIPSSSWLIPGLGRGRGAGSGRDQLCPSSAGGDSSPARFSAENRDEVAAPGSVC